jgi:hypothetical protein
MSTGDDDLSLRERLWTAAKAFRDVGTTGGGGRFVESMNALTPPGTGLAAVSDPTRLASPGPLSTLQVERDLGLVPPAPTPQTLPTRAELLQGARALQAGAGEIGRGGTFGAAERAVAAGLPPALAAGPPIGVAVPASRPGIPVAAPAPLPPITGQPPLPVSGLGPGEVPRGMRVVPGFRDPGYATTTGFKQLFPVGQMTPQTAAWERLINPAANRAVDRALATVQGSGKGDPSSPVAVANAAAAATGKPRYPALEPGYVSEAARRSAANSRANPSYSRGLQDDLEAMRGVRELRERVTPTIPLADPVLASVPGLKPQDMFDPNEGVIPGWRGSGGGIGTSREDYDAVLPPHLRSEAVYAQNYRPGVAATAGGRGVARTMADTYGRNPWTAGQPGSLAGPGMHVPNVGDLGTPFSPQERQWLADRGMPEGALIREYNPRGPGTPTSAWESQYHSRAERMAAPPGSPLEKALNNYYASVPEGATRDRNRDPIEAIIGGQFFRQYPGGKLVPKEAKGGPESPEAMTPRQLEAKMLQERMQPYRDLMQKPMTAAEAEQARLGREHLEMQKGKTSSELALEREKMAAAEKMTKGKSAEEATLEREKMALQRDIASGKTSPEVEANRRFQKFLADNPDAANPKNNPAIAKKAGIYPLTADEEIWASMGMTKPPATPPTLREVAQAKVPMAMLMASPYYKKLIAEARANPEQELGPGGTGETAFGEGVSAFGKLARQFRPTLTGDVNARMRQTLLKLPPEERAVYAKIFGLE